MREIKMAIIHCSDSDEVSADNMAEIRRWHVQERGFRDIGYHFVIRQGCHGIDRGTIEIGRPIEQIGAHCQGWNNFSIGIVLCGKANFNNDQFLACSKLLSMLKTIWPYMTIHAHNEFNKAKTCPNFPIEKVYPFV